jgi:hypothetical protein
MLSDFELFLLFMDGAFVLLGDLVFFWGASEGMSRLTFLRLFSLFSLLRCRCPRVGGDADDVVPAESSDVVVLAESSGAFALSNRLYSGDSKTLAVVSVSISM